MSQRNSGFKRLPMDLYQTREPWVVDALASYIHLKGRRIWECAAGEGKMIPTLQAHGAEVFATDVKEYGISPMMFRGLFDFTVPGACPWVNGFDLIVTNPPYGERGKAAELFIQRGLERIENRGAMALLLPVDFDSASTRSPFFGESKFFQGKIVLTKRIRWFEPEPGKKKSGPSANHAWFIWSRPISERPMRPDLQYAPVRRAA